MKAFSASIETVSNCFFDTKGSGWHGADAREGVGRDCHHTDGKNHHVHIYVHRVHGQWFHASLITSLGAPMYWRSSVPIGIAKPGRRG
ncbi:hypothetical protein BT96DRAFT_391625 [Gymnopus androsaceus JB14]|uniref:Uncharacterized protein n=1 Tax=Gymnopus androsaceus JB14 TaxID=1447944 RepID=A0A6A4GVD4_9AGAR|nr:hypothetical protein BT96DRAFT_391625 [Gymnopus androsaceus JB14]